MVMCKLEAVEKKNGKQKKGLWSPDEDHRLRSYILKHGHGCWSSVPVKAGLKRNGKSCRLRWINYLKPGLKRGMFTKDEEEIILALHSILGNKWSQIAQHLSGRTDNEIKNYWHSCLKRRKKISSAKYKESDDQSLIETFSSLLGPSSSSSSSSTRQTITSNDSFESLDTLKSSSFIQSSNYDSSNLHAKSGCRKPPKILFAEWLSLDQFQAKSLDDNEDVEATTANNFNQLSHFDQGSIFSGLFQDEGFHNHEQLKSENLFEDNDDFLNLISGDHLGSNFLMDMINDI